MADHEVDLAPDLRDRAAPWSTVCSPASAAPPVCLAICDTREAPSEIWREVARSSVIVVAIWLIAVTCSRAPLTCWLAAVWSSADEVWTWSAAEPMRWTSDRDSSQPIAIAITTAAAPPPWIAAVAVAAAALAERSRASSSERSSASISATTPRICSVSSWPCAAATRATPPSSPPIRRASITLSSSARRWSSSGRIASSRRCWPGLSAVNRRSVASVASRLVSAVRYSPRKWSAPVIT